MGRYTDDFAALNAIHRSQAKHEAQKPVDEDGFDIDYHLAQVDIAISAARRAHSMGVEGSLRFEADQAIAHLQAAVALSVIKEAMQ